MQMKNYSSTFRNYHDIKQNNGVLMQYIMMMCRFTGNVKLKGLVVIGGEQGSHPSVVRL